MEARKPSSPKFLIRPPTSGDLAGLSSLLVELGYPATAPAVEKRLARLATHNHVAVFVAELNRVPVGLATVHLLAVIHADDPAAILSALVVAEAHRGLGIGRGLVAAAEAWAMGCGAWRITVASGLARAGAHAFYERLGYEHTARRYAKIIAASPPPGMAN